MQNLGHRVLPLRYGENTGAPIRIVQITDLHHFPETCTEFDCTAAKGRIVPINPDTPYSTTRDCDIIAAVLDRVKPHLVVLTGDIVDGRPFGPSGDAQGWRVSILEVLRPICAFGCAWTWVPGNHDDDGGPWIRNDLLGIYSLGSAAPGCISEGVGGFDHTLTVSLGEPGSATSNDEQDTHMRLWFFDSGGNHEDKSLKYHTFQPRAVEGYKQLQASLSPVGCELAFFHIPLPQANGLRPVKGQNGLFTCAVNAGWVPAPWKWEPFTSIARFAGHDLITGASKLESGLFDAFVQNGRVRACFFGHDHASDAIFFRDGLFMVYGRVGATTPPVDWEGDAGVKPFEQGARVIEWQPPSGNAGTNGCPLRTWVELENEREHGSEFDIDPASVKYRYFRSCS